MTPGRKFSQTTSATRQRSWKIACPSGRSRLIATLFLFRLIGEEVGALALGPEERRAHDAHGVAALRILDLDHLGPEVGQEHRAIGARQHAREVEHPDAVEEHQRRRASTSYDGKPAS